MKYIKLFEDFMNEGVHDPAILKAFFMAGGPGSGKSYVAGELFGFPKSEISTVSYATGLKLVNSDDAFELLLKKAGYDLKKIAQYAKDEETWDQVMNIRGSAKKITKNKEARYLAGKLGLVMDGTGKDLKKVTKQRQNLVDLGYDTFMVFVNTSLEVAMERNQNRERKLPDDIVKEMWQQVQNNIGGFQRLFGRDNMMIIDNSSYDNAQTLREIEKTIRAKVKLPIENPIGQKWIELQGGR